MRLFLLVWFWYAAVSGASEIGIDLPRKCSSGKACFKIGEEYAAREESLDNTIAAAYYQRACRVDYRQGCFKLGLAYQDAKGVKRNAAKAAENFKKACMLDYGDACAYLGILYEDDPDIPRDYAKARVSYASACDLGVGLGCVRLGEMFLNGRGVKKSRKKALDYIDKSCRLGSGLGCLRLGDLYMKGLGVEQNRSRAMELYEKVSKTYHYGEAYVKTGQIYLQEENDSDGRVKAENDFKKACDRHYADGCNALASLMKKEEGSTLEYIESLYKESCALKSAAGCRQAGVLWAGNGGMESNLSKAIVYLKKACDLDDGEGCSILGKLLSGDNGSSRNRAEGIPYQDRACRLGVAESCVSRCSEGEMQACLNLEKLRWQKGSREQNATADFKYSKLACSKGDAQSCLRLWRIYSQESLLPKETVKTDQNALEYLLSACKYGSADACLIAGTRGGGVDYYEKACMLKSAEGCRLLAQHYSKKSISKSNQLLRKSCDLGSREGCAALGMLNLRKKSYRQSEKFFRKACALGSGKGCYEMGRLYTDARGVRWNNATAREFFKQGCYLDNAYSCSSLGFLYEYGEYRAEAAVPDYAMAKLYYDHACRMENGGGCALLGSLYEKGLGVDQNLTEADSLYHKACILGAGYGCDKAGKAATKQR